MQRTVLVAVLLLVTGCAGGRGWSRADTLAQMVIGAEVLGDSVQTARGVTTCSESNPIIGACGERVPVLVYMGAALALETVVAWALPPAWRRWFEGGVAGVEADVIYGNWLVQR
jgi:hypothetical protein